MFCIIAYLALVKLIFFFRLITSRSRAINLTPKLWARIAFLLCSVSLILKPLFFWYLGKKNSDKKNHDTTFARAHSNPHSLSGCFLLFFLFFIINRKNREALVLNVFFTQHCCLSRQQLRLCVCPLLMLFLQYFC